MSARSEQGRIELANGARVAVIGGGPAGAFFAIHLLRKARALGRSVRVTLFERRSLRTNPLELCSSAGWKGCNHCAGGISPKLNDALKELGLDLPPDLIQSRIGSVIIQGYWKNIELEVPPGREMFSVYRGSRPSRRADRHRNFDSFLLSESLKQGAELIATEVTDVRYSESGKPVVLHRAGGIEKGFESDLVVFAAGVNQEVGKPAEESRILQCMRRLAPEFVPARLRRALILELEARPRVPGNLAGTVYFVEYGSKALPLEMCSLVPKRGFVTVVLIGAGVDAALQTGDGRQVIRQFLSLPHIRKLVSPGTDFVPACFCSPNIVVHQARNPFANRVAAVGDVVAARLYKDGILSAFQTARCLAETVLEHGVDAESLRRGCEPVLRRFARDNRFARRVFLLHRMFFGSSVLSRVLYQAVIDERKSTPMPRRRLEQMLWRICSGDDDYEQIFRSMIHPSTLGSILTRGALLTLRNYLTELWFGLRWEGFGRFTTGVAIERLEEKRQQFARLIADARVAVPPQLEFERMYTIRVAAPRAVVLRQLQQFGEPDRQYLRPRWLRVRRIEGAPDSPGCVIQYEVLNRRLRFRLVLEQMTGGHMAVYRVRDGFARGGVLIFEIEDLPEGVCALSIYVAFNFLRGSGWGGRPFWRLFRLLFPAFVHDVIWNHSLCQLKDIAEKEYEESRAAISAAAVPESRRPSSPSSSETCPSSSSSAASGKIC
jgi:flavin-dependent dehydrogenase